MRVLTILTSSSILRVVLSLQLHKVGQYLLVAPPRAAARLPSVVIQPATPDRLHVVDAAASSEHLPTGEHALLQTSGTRWDGQMS